MISFEFFFFFCEIFRLTWFLWVFCFAFGIHFFQVRTPSPGFHQRGFLLVCPRTSCSAFCSLVAFPSWPPFLPQVTPPSCFLIMWIPNRIGDFSKPGSVAALASVVETGSDMKDHLTASLLRQGLMDPRSTPNWQWHWTWDPLVFAPQSTAMLGLCSADDPASGFGHAK